MQFTSIFKTKWLCFGFAILLMFFWFARKPDFDLQFSREIPSDLSSERLFRNISYVNRWPQWFYHLDGVEGIHEGAPLRPGSLLVMKMNPHKGINKPFDLSAEVIRYVPNNQLSLKILNDSTGRMSQLFESLEWNIELIENLKGSGSLIRGTSRARTRNWRSRFLGRISEKILMNQTFHPDLMKLSELRRPYQEGLEKRGVDLLGSPNQTR